MSITQSTTQVKFVGDNLNSEVQSAYVYTSRSTGRAKGLNHIG